MHYDIPDLDASGLRGFAFKMSFVIVLLFGGFLPWLFEFAWPVWPWILAGVLTLWGLVAPSTLNRVYRGWMRVGLAVGVFNSKIILGLVFFVIVMPAGFIMRAVGRDPMLRKLHTGEASYRVNSKPIARTHLERPY